MKLRKYTYLFIAIMVIIIAVYDVYVFIAGGTETTISHVMITWAYDYPIFPFIMGIVCGHLFWRMPGDLKEYIHK